MRGMAKRIGLAVAVGLVIGATPARSESISWPWYDDPISVPIIGTSTFGGPNVNDLFTPISIQNSGPAHEIGLIMPLVQVSDDQGALTWDQSRDGWYGNARGTSLLVTVTSPSTRLPFSEVADGTGMAQLVHTFAPPFGATTDPSASYPFLDLGVVPPGVTGPVTVDFHFAWGDGRSGVLGPSALENFTTIAPNPSFATVPEPSSLVLASFPIALALACAWRRRRAA
jgi:hypothetical protein